MPPAKLSRFEELLLGIEKDISMIIRLWNNGYHRTIPTDRLVIVLPIASVLQLRAVSRSAKACVDENFPDLLTRLQVPCPVPRFALQARSTLSRLANDCQHLTIQLAPSSQPIRARAFQSSSPAAQMLGVLHNFSSLRIVPPSKDTYEPLCSMRLAIESTELKNLTSLHIEPLSIAGLTALRWGGFDAFTDSSWVGQSYWRGIKNLRIGMKNYWLMYEHPNLDGMKEGQQKMKMKEERSYYRQGIQILHNYFFHFSLHRTLETLRFDWIGGDGTGPNPLLLDEVVTRDKGAKWFSAPGNTWRALQEIWLGGVAVSGEDVIILKYRMQGLVKMMVWEHLAAPEISGGIHFIDGVVWLEVDLNADIQLVEEEMGEVEDLFDVEDGEPRNRSESMVLPFVLIVD
ncbi:MAG: hypothetical protein Q9208_000630 [Pyrenodesmia sp. 3 TL-2023]